MHTEVDNSRISKGVKLHVNFSNLALVFDLVLVLASTATNLLFSDIRLRKLKTFITNFLDSENARTVLLIAI